MHRKLLIVGVAPVHAQLLAEALEHLYEVLVLDVPLLDIPRDLDPDTVIVSGSDGLTDSPAQAAMRLRTERFLWQPVVLLDRSSTLHAAVEWSIYVEEMPPDLQQLSATIDGAVPVAPERRPEAVKYALYGLWEDLSAAARSLTGSKQADLGALRALLAVVRDECKASADEPYAGNMLTLGDRIGEVLDRLEIGHIELGPLADAVVAAETAAREHGAPQQLRSDLHRLSNAIRFHTWTDRAGGDHLQRVLDRLEHLPLDVTDRLHEGLGAQLTAVRTALRAALSAEAMAAIRDGVDAAGSEAAAVIGDAMERIGGSLAAIRETEQPELTERVPQVLVIEDDRSWCGAIVGMLQGLGLAGITRVASDAGTAAGALADAPDGTIVLIDLGLPAEPSGDGGLRTADEVLASAAGASDDLDRDGPDGLLGTTTARVIDLDAGLRLMREFSGRGRKLRFIVLTGAANYSDAVRAALAAGVNPWDYIQKGHDWREQLASRMQVAVAGTAPILPRVQVLRSTVRVARVDDVEVELDHKPYVVFEYLAARAPHWCPVDQMRADLTSPGPMDITPPIGKQDLEMAKRGEQPFPSPYQLLSEKHLQDYIYEIRRAVDNAFTHVGGRCDADRLVEYQDAPAAYRLKAQAELVDHFAAGGTSAGPMSVLVVEDAEEWSKLVSEALSRLGFDVRRAATLEDAQAAVEDTVPDLISLDLQIPRTRAELGTPAADESNSLAFLDWLSERTDGIRVAVLTSIEWKDSVMLGFLRRGVRVVDFISKGWTDPIERLERSLWRLMMERQRGARLIAPDAQFRLHSIEVDTDDASAFLVDGCGVQLAPGPAAVFGVLAQSRNAPVDRDTLKTALWPDPDDWPDDHDGALNTVVRRMREAIGKATGDRSVGDDVIRGKDGVYWLQGVVSSRGADG